MKICIKMKINRKEEKNNLNINRYNIFKIYIILNIF